MFSKTYISPTEFSRLFLIVLLVTGLNPMAYSTQEVDNHFTNIEPIYGFEVMRNKVKFVVISRGCTKREHFSLQMNASEHGHTELTLVRNKRDLCRAKPKRVQIELPFTEYPTTAQLKIGNPIRLDLEKRFKVPL